MISVCKAQCLIVNLRIYEIKIVTCYLRTIFLRIGIC